MKRIPLVTLLVVALAMVLAGCGLLSLQYLVQVPMAKLLS